MEAFKSVMAQIKKELFVVFPPPLLTVPFSEFENKGQLLKRVEEGS
jgi:hypothetical protein